MLDEELGDNEIIIDMSKKGYFMSQVLLSRGLGASGKAWAMIS